jgi:hypothetical protein
MEINKQSHTVEQAFDENGLIQDAITLLNLNPPGTEHFHKSRINSVWKCAFCGEPVMSGGGNGGKMKRHLKHRPNGKYLKECPWYKGNTSITPEQINALKYNGAKESEKHEEYKLFIAFMLEEEERFSNIKIEKRITGEKLLQRAKWRQPDVFSLKDGSIKLAFEVQLQTILIEAIKGRREFYKEQNIFIVWLFDDINISEYRYSEGDIFFTNNQNGFFMNRKTMALSRKNSCLMIGVRYRKYNLDGDFESLTKIVNLHQLTYNEKTREVYYYDTEGNRDFLISKIEETEFTIIDGKAHIFINTSRS